MASSDNLAFMPTFGDCWISELFARDADTLTKALQKSLSNSTYNSTFTATTTPTTTTMSYPETSPAISPTTTSFSDGPFKPDPVQTPTVSGLSGSDPESSGPKCQRVSPLPPSGKVSKRKSRATKRSQTTFITADPANFRQMVQQVTGVRFGSAQFAASAPVLKPEPQRPCSRFPVAGGCLPTLDTSAFLLDQQPVGPMASLVGGGGGGSVQPQLSSFAPPMGVGGDVGAGAGGGLDFDTFPSFPTLESWKVM